MLIAAQNLQEHAVRHASVFSWHELELAGRMFPFDPTLRENAAFLAVELNIPKCMALPAFKYRLETSPKDPRWQAAVRILSAQPGPASC